MKKAALCLCAVLIAACLASCAPRRYKVEFYDTFDTVSTVSGYADDEAAFQGYAVIIHEEMLRLHQLFDIYHDYEGLNNLKTVNDNAGLAPVVVHRDVIELLERAQAAYVDTQGALNVMMGPLLRVWHTYRQEGMRAPENAALPPPAALQAAAALSGMDGLLIDAASSTVFLREQGMCLDVGAIAKGFAAQRAADLAREAGFSSGLLDAGGNVLIIGPPADGREGWSIGIQAANGQAGSLFSTVNLRGGCAVTSGEYQRYYVVDGARYHHVIDPATLYPSTEAAAVTIFHEDSTTAEILSTAALILPYQAAEALVLASGAQALWLYADGSHRATSGYTLRAPMH